MQVFIIILFAGISSGLHISKKANSGIYSRNLLFMSAENHPLKPPMMPVMQPGVCYLFQKRHFNNGCF